MEALIFEYFLFFLIIVILHVAVYLFITRKKKKQIFGRHVVVTGGSSGIGLQVAIKCAQLGADVTIIARNKGLLEKAQQQIIEKRLEKSQKIEYKVLDLSKSYDDVAKALAQCEQEIGPIYMLVNCAGLAICGTIEDTTVADAHHLMNVNYFGTFYPTKYLLPKMKKAGEGIIVITSSQAALLGIYGLGAYAATKFALRGLAETIAMEASHTGVTVTLCLPADTDTPGFEQEQKSKPKETKIIAGTGGLADPKDVAEQLLTDALKGNFFSILGLESWLVTILCSGMSPWNGLGLTTFCACVLGPIKIVGAIIQWNFQKIVKNCAKEKQA